MPTHGSLTKAGKVRGQTPKLEAKKRHAPPPRIRARDSYMKRFELKRKAGQNWLTR